MTLEDWAAGRQASWNTAETIVAGIVERAVGRVPSTLIRIQGGAQNEVWEASLGDGDVVVRIAHRRDARLASEAWALDRATEVGAPVARGWRSRTTRW